MIGAQYAKPFGKTLVNQRWYAVTSILLRNIATKSKTVNEIPSRYLSQEKASFYSNRNADIENGVNLCTRDHNIHVELPQYLRRNYWWAYINPTMISILDRKWLVNVVLWGNFTKLRDAAVQELLDTTPQVTHNNNTGCSSTCGAKIHGNILQISSVYADLTETIVENLAEDATLDVIDVIPAQLINLQHKLERSNVVSNHEHIHKVSLTCCDASNLSTHFPNNNTFDKVLIFFLLHETPSDVRQKVLAEACRVVKHDGKIVIIDYHKPNTALWRCIMQLMYDIYEPFAMDLWNHPLSHWLPYGIATHGKETYFGGLHQKLVLQSCRPK